MNEYVKALDVLCFSSVSKSREHIKLSSSPVKFSCCFEASVPGCPLAWDDLHLPLSLSSPFTSQAAYFDQLSAHLEESPHFLLTAEPLGLVCIISCVTFLYLWRLKVVKWKEA